MVAGEHQGGDPREPRLRPALPGREPQRQLLEPAERAGRLGELRLARRCGRQGRLVRRRQLPEPRAQVIKARDLGRGGHFG